MYKEFMDLQAAITLALAIFGLAIKPGPGMMAMMSRTLAQGMPACLVFVTGVCMVSLFYLALVFTGLKFAEEDLLFVTILIKALTAVYLIHLGIKGLLNPDVSLSLTDQKEEKLFDNFTASIMLTLSNPLVIVFYGALLPSILHVESMGLSDMVIAAFIMMAVEVATAVAYCLPVAYSRNIVTPSRLRNVSIFSSVILICIGLYIGWSALPAKDILSITGG